MKKAVVTLDVVLEELESNLMNEDHIRALEEPALILADQQDAETFSRVLEVFIQFDLGFDYFTIRNGIQSIRKEVTA